MASTEMRRSLVLSLGSGTLKGTVSGTTLQCRVRLGAGLRARLTPSVYRISTPTKYSSADTVAYATLASSGHTPEVEGGAVMFNPDPVEIEKVVNWNTGSKEGAPASLKGEVTGFRWTPTGAPGTLVLACRALGGWNDVVVLNSYDELMRALKAAGGCLLSVQP
jgi:hypothetical protein